MSEEDGGATTATDKAQQRERERGGECWPCGRRREREGLVTVAECQEGTEKLPMLRVKRTGRDSKKKKESDNK